MSEQKQNTSETTRIFIQGIPFYLTKDNRVLKQTNAVQSSTNTASSGQTAENNIKKSIKLMPVYQEDSIYESTNQNDEHLKGEFQKIVLKNRLHRLTNSSRTIASYVTLDNTKVEKTSDNVANLIGQKNYDAIFVALCSVISQELKIRAMLALLTLKKSTEDAACQTDITNDHFSLKNYRNKVESSCQTDEVSPDLFNKKRYKIKQRVTPLVIKGEQKEDNKMNFVKIAPKVNKIIINPNSKEDCEKINLNIVKFEKTPVMEDKKPALPELKLMFDEDSNSSVLSNISMSNVSVCSEILKNQEMKLLSVTNHNIEKSVPEPLKQVEKPDSTRTEALFCENVFIVTFDGTKIAVPVKPEDQFHLATPEILEHITSEERRKLLWHQAYIDWKLCLETDEDGNMPIHLAALHQDVDLIRRQGLMLKSKKRTVDEPNAKGLTALKMCIQHSVSPACCEALLELGADPLLCDVSLQTSLHLAAEATPALLRAVLSALSRRAREIIEDHEDMQYPGLLEKSDVEIARHLFLQASVMSDIQGYTPLMLACKMGNVENVILLVERSPETVDTAMPNSGNTALSLAVAEACLTAADSSNRTKVSDNFLKTIEVLLENGADPEIENLYGLKVSDMLQEFNIHSLSMLIANKVTLKFFDNPMQGGSNNFDAFILLKDDEGNVKIVKNEKDKLKIPIPYENPTKTLTSVNKGVKRQIDSKKVGAKPVILENVAINTKKSAAQVKKLYLPKIAPKPEDGSSTLYIPTLQGAQVVKVSKTQLPKGEPSTIVDIPSNIIIKNQDNAAQPVSGQILFTVPLPKAAPNTSTKPVIINPKGTATLIKVTLPMPTNSTCSVVATLPNMSNVPVTVMENLNDLNKTSGETPPKGISQRFPVKSVRKIVTTNENSKKSTDAILKNVTAPDMPTSDNAVSKRKATDPLDLTIDEMNKKQKSCD